MLPRELGCGSGMTCWRRLRDWHTAGVWERLHHELLNHLHDEGQIDSSRAHSTATASPRSMGATTPDRTLRIGESLEANGISSWIGTGCRLPFSSRPRMSTIAELADVHAQHQLEGPRPRSAVLNSVERVRVRFALRGSRPSGRCGGPRTPCAGSPQPPRAPPLGARYTARAPLPQSQSTPLPAAEVRLDRHAYCEYRGDRR